MSHDSAQLDATDRLLLNRLQSGLPLAANPFDDLAGETGVSVPELLSRIDRLKRDGVIRQICAIFDTPSLGYRSSLVAGRVAPDRVSDAAAIVSRHPGVTHNYRRNHDYNLWFTLAVPP
ncbi:MAG: AsnC family transcriptional regulator, partial [Phycisphaerae bacterium]|nr:AsnC family transcriptional regulator [Phycisphaerae bacterium]